MRIDTTEPRSVPGIRYGYAPTDTQIMHSRGDMETHIKDKDWSEITWYYNQNLYFNDITGSIFLFILHWFYLSSQIVLQLGYFLS